MADYLNDNEREELIAYLDGELAQTDAQTVEKKLNTDPRYRAEAEAMRRTWNLLDFLPKSEPSANFTNRTVSRLSAVRPTLAATPAAPMRRWWLGVGWAAAMVTAVLVGYAATNKFTPDVRPSARDLTAEADARLARDLRLLEQLGLLQYVDDIQLLNELDRPELFGDDQ